MPRCTGLCLKIPVLWCCLVSFIALPVMAEQCVEYESLSPLTAMTSTPGSAHAVAVTGDHLLVADGAAGLQVYSIASLTNPILVAGIALPEIARDVVVEGDLALLAADGLQVVDITDPTAPALVGSLDVGDVISGLEVVNGLVYLYGAYTDCASGRSDLHIVDISDPTVPVLLSTSAEGGHTEDIAQQGNIACLAITFWGWKQTGPNEYDCVSEGEFCLLDVTDPNAPLFLSCLPHPVGFQSQYRAAQFIGNYLYLSSYYTGIEIYDVTDPTAPVLLSTFGGVSSIAEMLLVGETLYLSQRYGAIQVADVANPEAPVVTGVIDLLVSSVLDKPCFVGGIGYVPCDEDGIAIINVVDAASPILVGPLTSAVGHLPAIDAQFEVTAGDQVYIASNNPAALQIVDVNDPTNPTLVCNHVPSGALFLTDIAKSGDTVALGSFNMTGGPVGLYDVSDPASPVLVGQYPVGVIGISNCVALRGAALYAELNGDLHVVDIANPALPVWQSTLPGVRTHVVRGQELYCIERVVLDDFFVVFDISHPLIPAEMARIPFDGNCQNLFVIDDTVYLMQGTHGIDLVDISDPLAPVLTGAIHTGGESRTVAGLGSFVYMGDNDALHVVDARIPTAPVFKGSFTYDVGFVGASSNHILVSGPDGLLVLPSDCDDPVPAFLMAFDASVEAGGVQLRWTFSQGVSAADLRLVGRGAAGEWEIPVDHAGGYQFTARDDTGSLTTGPVTYSLYHRRDSGQWHELGSREVQAGDLPTATCLLGAHPNPFNPQTDIVFSLHRAQRVNLAVYDVTGRLVRQLADELFAPGEQRVPWLGRNEAGREVASGVYFVRFEADGRVESDKLFLVR